jgi:hypothetical protein
MQPGPDLASRTPDRVIHAGGYMVKIVIRD